MDKLEGLEAVREASKWRNRRRMAWLALLSLITVTVGALFKAPEAVGTLGVALAGVVMAYVGSATWHQINAGRTMYRGSGYNDPMGRGIGPGGVL